MTQLKKARPVVVANHHMMHLLRTSIDEDRLYTFETALSADNTLVAFAPPSSPNMLVSIRKWFTPSETRAEAAHGLQPSSSTLTPHH